MPVPLLRPIALAVLLGLSPAYGHAQEAPRDGLAGALLSGRAAAASDNFAQIADSYERALLVDPENPFFRELAMQGNLLTGNFERAAELAALISATDQGSQVANIILQADEFERRAFDAALGAVADGRLTGALTDLAAEAWAHVGLGRVSDALTTFERALDERPELAPFALYLKALMLAYVGDLESASAILSGDAEGPVSLTRRGVLAHLAILSQLGQFDIALELAEDMFGAHPEEDAALVVDALRAGQTIPFTVVRNATDGMAEVYLMLSAALLGDRGGDWLPLIYARLALALRPDNGDAILLTGQLLERYQQFELAQDVYQSLPATHPQFLAARLGQANALFATGDKDGAIAKLQALTEARPDSVLAFTALGDMLRREERYAEAEAAYAAALDLIGTPEERHWVLLYTRAIALERMGEFDRAEPIFRQVLEFVPDEPQVLNYLGYSLVEARRNLDEALEMIERAVAGDPESGYITDSLGWALFRLGRFDEALPVMERAVELLPADPILNDHLGDVYWAVGRYREARFQWRRAISFAPHPDLDLDRVRRKLELGLYQVLEEEGADPLHSPDP
jgi:tetratricopeptide (TPR) repeat protein